MTERTVRTRISVSKTSTGKYSWDCTVEVSGETANDIGWDSQNEGEAQRKVGLYLSDALVAELQKRYPPE